MARREVDTLQLATGPYEVDKLSGPVVAGSIKFRHYKAEELDLARDFVKSAALPGTYFFDYYLMTDAARHIASFMQPPMLKDIVPWLMRVDLVVFQGNKVWIIEFKDRLRPSGVGQLLSYKKLWLEQYGSGKGINLGYVARDDDPTLHSTLTENKITWWIVPKTERT